ncbi:MAG: pyridoxamine 5'-phosphate oxidase family protein [Eubacteriales bacterium]|nr:pyridoxamine 5'-phosphate oxidase family protein [Eubacteriales bacterium]
MNSELVTKAGTMIRAMNKKPEDYFCTLALLDKDGYPTASTISISESEGIRWLTFCTGLTSNKANRIRECNRASVCINALQYNITLVGTVEILTGTDIKKEMWYEALSHHFNGPQDPGYCVLRFNTERYNLLIDWQSEEGTL